MFLKKKKKRIGQSLPDMALIIAFIGVVAVVSFNQMRDELKDFFNNFTNLQNSVQAYSKDAAKSDTAN